MRNVLTGELAFAVRRVWRTGLASALLLPGGLALPVQAQDMHVRVQHGEGGTGIIGYERGDRVVEYNVPQQRLTRIRVQQGDSICIDVENAHPVFYAYSVAAQIDTAAEKLPESLTSLAGLLQTLVPAMAAGVTTDRLVQMALEARAPTTAFDSVVTEFYRLAWPLASALTDVQAAVKRSDVLGVRYAKDTVATLPRRPTTEELGKWLEDSQARIPATNTLHRMIVAALSAYGESQLATRTALQKTYPRNLPEIARHCAAAGAGETTVTLKVAKKVDFAGRDVGDALVTVVAEPRYERAILEAFPLLLIAHATDVPRFGLQDGAIVRTVEEDARVYRAGAALVVNLPGSGEIAYGPALGLGVSTGGELSVSDLFIGAVVSYRDQVRIGLGFGTTEVPSGLRAPAEVGASLGDSEKLEDLITRADRRAWYFTIALPKLTLKSPW